MKKALKRVAKLFPRAVTGLRGDVSNLWGVVSSDLWGNVTGLWGDVTGLRGDVSDLRGVVSGLRGDVSALRGIVSGLRGDVSGLRGEVNGLHGCVTGLHGNLDDCQLTAEERLNGIDIASLVADDDLTPTIEEQIKIKETK